MSPTSSNPKAAAGPYRKPRADLYTALLILALLAILVATLVLWMETDSTEYPPPSYKGVPHVSLRLEGPPGQTVGWVEQTGTLVGLRSLAFTSAQRSA